MDRRWLCGRNKRQREAETKEWEQRLGAGT